MNQDFKELLEAFEGFGVRFLIIGGFAVIKYTEPRYTKDLDLWIAIDGDNPERVYNALVDFGAPIQGMRATDFTSNGFYFSMGTPPNQVDVWLEIPGVQFRDCWERRVAGELFGVPVSFISRQDLVVNKETVGRLQDLADAEKLRETDF
ncbi:MAG: hypothetical protein QM785_07435 [Pyrinomonadaceae bacterium]